LSDNRKFLLSDKHAWNFLSSLSEREFPAMMNGFHRRTNQIVRLQNRSVQIKDCEWNKFHGYVSERIVARFLKIHHFKANSVVATKIGIHEKKKVLEDTDDNYI